VFREFVSELAGTQGIEIPDRGVPAPVAGAAAIAAETIWRTLRLTSTPPMTRFTYWVMALETTIDIGRARAELGYEPVRSIEDGMAELRRNAGGSPAAPGPAQ
jgi:nucleoside-diphosphate-sugar epimerase